MAHWLTNRGKLLIVQGIWDEAAAGNIKLGLCSGASIPTTVDTEAEIQDLDSVASLLALTGVVEANFTNYARTALTRSVAAEDDTNNRVNMDASDVTITSAGGTTNNTLWGGFCFLEDASDAARALLSLFTFASVITTNGSNLSLPIADFYRGV